jgi:hypothetical protein
MYKTRSLLVTSFLVTSLLVLFKTSITVTSNEIMISCPTLPRIFSTAEELVIGIKGRPAKHGRGPLSNVRNMVGMTNQLVMMPPPLSLLTSPPSHRSQAEYFRLPSRI